MRLIWLSVVLAFVACGPTRAKPGPVSVTHRSQQLTFGGDRPVTISVPDSYEASKPTPLIVLLHGYSVNGYIQTVYLGFDQLVNEAGVILAAPDGTIDDRGNRFWNATDACCNFGNKPVDDVAYITQLIHDISAEWNVDPKRVYVAGHSNGGFMSYRMACEHPELIAGIMALAGDTWLDSSRCHPSEAVSVLDIQGDNDETIHADGGANDGHSYPGALQSVTMWAGYDGCTGTFVASGDALDIEYGLAGAETTQQHNSSCPAGIDVALWTIRGGSHEPTFADSFRTHVWSWMSAHAKR